MRPVQRGISPRTTDYSEYKDAKGMLVSRIGAGRVSGIHLASCCSFCERKFDSMLAVEHIEPKDGPFGKPLLIGKWDNFLLACVNCNSTKGAKKVDLSNVFLPDRDNTFYAFEYLPDGTVTPNSALIGRPEWTIAKNTLGLVGLDKPSRQTLDEKGMVIAEDRAGQRMETWKLAEILKSMLTSQAAPGLRASITANAVTSGFFSVWMKVFEADPDMRNRFIDAFSGTRASGCFDPISTAPISPAPNPDNLPHGGKV